MALQSCFGAGMAYVALSRGRALDGIQLMGWKAEIVQTDPAVVAFYASLPGMLADGQGMHTAIRQCAQGLKHLGS